jgi:hypothetical protein
VRFAWVYEGGWQPLLGIWAFDGATWRQSYPPVAGALNNIIVSPPTVTLAALGTQAFTANGYDIDGLPVAITPVWTIDTLTDNINSSSGFFTAGVVADTCTVSATDSSITGTAVVTNTG